jgi:hypothetical protein
MTPPTIELVLLHPAVAPGPDPLVGLLVAMMAIWVLATPWLRLCWWLGARTRSAR